MFTLTEINQAETNIFDCLSLKTEHVVPYKKTEIIDYMVTVFPREERISSFQFVHNLFKPTEQIALSQNQHLVLNLANKLFSKSFPLENLEQSVLNNTFNRLLKTEPILPGRK